MGEGSYRGGHSSSMIELVNPQGVEIALATTADNISATLQTTLTNGGRYLVLASDAGNNEVGSYASPLQRLNSQTNAPLLAYGQTTNGMISQVGQFNSYQFAASALDVLRVVMCELCPYTTHFRSMIELVNPQGVEIALATTADNISATLQTTLTNGGRYLLLASDAGNNEVGSYALTLQDRKSTRKKSSHAYRSYAVCTMNQDSQFNSYQFDAS